jgi:hypothetical protein
VARAGGSSLALSLTPTGPVYVCLIGDGGRKLIPGSNLQAGETDADLPREALRIDLGNSSVTMYIDGTARAVRRRVEPIGYSITKARGRQTLPSRAAADVQMSPW